MNLFIVFNKCQTYAPREDDANLVRPKLSDAMNATSMMGQAIMATEMVSSYRNHTKVKKHLIVVTLESPPFIMKRQSSESNHTVEWYGYCIDFFNELIKHLPYEVSFEIYQVEDNKFGSKTKQIIMETDDGKYPVPKKLERWNGLIGDLQNGKAHVALAPLAVMAERELVIDFTVPFYDLVGIQILLKKPEVPQDWFKFLTVLDSQVWLSITVAYFVTSFVIFIFDRLSPYSHKNLARLRKISENRKREMKLTEETTKSANENDQINSISNGRNFACNTNLLTNFSNQTTVNNNAIRTTDQGRLTVDKGICHIMSDISSRSPSLGISSFDPIFKKMRGSVRPSTGESFTSRTRRLSHDYLQTLGLRGNSWSPDMGDAESDEPMDDGKPDFGLRDSLWFCITSLTPQGGGEAPQNLSGRIVAGAWWLFCFIVIASYTANLAAFLTVSRLDIPIESLDDLAKQYRIKYAPVDGTAEQTYFERMAYIEEIFYNIWKEMSLNDSLTEVERSKFAVWDYPISDKYTKIWAQIQEVGMPPDIEAGIKRVKSSNLDDGFALLADANLVKHAVMTDCSFKAAGDEFSRKPIALGIQKGQEQLRDDISYAILQLINRRFMEVLREKWWTNNPNRIMCENKDESEGISIENIGGVFIIILAGVILSFFVWAIERFVYKTRIDVSRGLNE